MTVLNDLDRFHLVMDVVDRVPKLGYKGAYLKQLTRDKLIEHKEYITAIGEDMPEIRDWHMAFIQFVVARAGVEKFQVAVKTFYPMLY